MTSSSIQANMTYIRPLPDLPVQSEVWDVNDLFTYSYVFQIHATLFRFDDQQLPKPYLVETFSVSLDQMRYQFTLKQANFHSGAPLTGLSVKKSLERAIGRRAANFESFLSIEGVKDFLEKKAASIRGLTAGSLAHEFMIQLAKPDPNIISKLTDIRFAVWDVDSKISSNGIGPYQVSKDDAFVLERRIQPSLDGFGLHGPNKVKLVKMTQPGAVSAFAKGEVDDLFFYTVTPRELSAAATERAHVHTVLFPRTYVLVLNSRTIKSLPLRKHLLSLLDREKMTRECYPEQSPSIDLVPEGFSGHSLKPKDIQAEFLHDPQVKQSKTVHPINIAILDGIGSEPCAEKNVERMLKPAGDVSAKVMKLSTFSQAWEKSQIDGFFAYIEGESTANYFGSFNPKAAFSIGDVTDRDFDRLFQAVDLERDPKKRQEAAERLSEHILSLATVKPLFHPKTYLIYQNRFERVNARFRSAALTPLTIFNLNPKPVKRR